MKKIVIALLIVVWCAGFAVTQEIKFSGEAKTGILWTEYQDMGKPVNTQKSGVGLGSKDDAGSQQGRFRLNLDYDNGNHAGFRARINWENWTSDTNAPDWGYAFGYGNYFDDQLTISLGKLGASPWGTGGPELWKELEVGRFGGMRVEYKPGFFSEDYGKINLGFVLNWLDDPDEASINRNATMTDILQESVLGFSYTHDLFHFRFAYRLDSDMDSKQRMDGKKEGDKVVYRVEERVIKNYLPDFQVWALGYLVGVGAEEAQFYDFQNWLFLQYAPDLFTAQLRLGYKYVENRQISLVKPSLYFNFFQKMLTVGCSFEYAQDYGNRVYEPAPYHYLELEPKVQINLTGSYIAFVYNWHYEYIGDYPERKSADPIRQIQFMNLRFCIYF